MGATDEVMREAAKKFWGPLKQGKDIISGDIKISVASRGQYRTIQIGGLLFTKSVFVAGYWESSDIRLLQLCANGRNSIEDHKIASLLYSIVAEARTGRQGQHGMMGPPDSIVDMVTVEYDEKTGGTWLLGELYDDRIKIKSEWEPEPFRIGEDGLHARWMDGHETWLELSTEPTAEYNRVFRRPIETEEVPEIRTTETELDAVQRGIDKIEGAVQTRRTKTGDLKSPAVQIARAIGKGKKYEQLLKRRDELMWRGNPKKRKRKGKKAKERPVLFIPDAEQLMLRAAAKAFWERRNYDNKDLHIKIQIHIPAGGQEVDMAYFMDATIKGYTIAARFPTEKGHLLELVAPTTAHALADLTVYDWLLWYELLGRIIAYGRGTAERDILNYLSVIKTGTEPHEKNFIKIGIEPDERFWLTWLIPSGVKDTAEVSKIPIPDDFTIRPYAFIDEGKHYEWQYPGFLFIDVEGDTYAEYDRLFRPAIEKAVVKELPVAETKLNKVQVMIDAIEIDIRALRAKERDFTSTNIEMARRVGKVNEYEELLKQRDEAMWRENPEPIYKTAVTALFDREKNMNYGMQMAWGSGVRAKYRVRSDNDPERTALLTERGRVAMIMADPNKPEDTYLILNGRKARFNVTQLNILRAIVAEAKTRGCHFFDKVGVGTKNRKVQGYWEDWVALFHEDGRYQYIRNDMPDQMTLQQASAKWKDLTTYTAINLSAPADDELNRVLIGGQKVEHEVEEVPMAEQSELDTAQAMIDAIELEIRALRGNERDFTSSDIAVAERLGKREQYEQLLKQRDEAMWRENPKKPYEGPGRIRRYYSVLGEHEVKGEMEWDDEPIEEGDEITETMDPAWDTEDRVRYTIDYLTDIAGVEDMSHDRWQGETILYYHDDYSTGHTMTRWEYALEGFTDDEQHQVLEGVRKHMNLPIIETEMYWMETPTSPVESVQNQIDSIEQKIARYRAANKDFASTPIEVAEKLRTRQRYEGLLKQRDELMWRGNPEPFRREKFDLVFPLRKSDATGAIALDADGDEMWVSATIRNGKVMNELTDYGYFTEEDAAKSSAKPVFTSLGLVNHDDSITPETTEDYEVVIRIDGHVGDEYNLYIGNEGTESVYLIIAVRKGRVMAELTDYDYHSEQAALAVVHVGTKAPGNQVYSSHSGQPIERTEVSEIPTASETKLTEVQRGIDKIEKLVEAERKKKNDYKTTRVEIARSLGKGKKYEDLLKQRDEAMWRENPKKKKPSGELYDSMEEVRQAFLYHPTRDYKDKILAPSIDDPETMMPRFEVEHPDGMQFSGLKGSVLYRSEQVVASYEEPQGRRTVYQVRVPAGFHGREELAALLNYVLGSLKSYDSKIRSVFDKIQFEHNKDLDFIFITGEESPRHRRVILNQWLGVPFDVTPKAWNSVMFWEATDLGTFINASASEDGREAQKEYNRIFELEYVISDTDIPEIPVEAMPIEQTQKAIDAVEDEIRRYRAKTKDYDSTPVQIAERLGKREELERLLKERDELLWGEK